MWLDWEGKMLCIARTSQGGGGQDLRTSGQDLRTRLHQRARNYVIRAGVYGFCASNYDPHLPRILGPVCRNLKP